MQPEKLDAGWNTTEEEERWRDMADRSAAVSEKLKDSLFSHCDSQFSILCLAEADAVRQLRIPECCYSRVAMISELRRLVAEPTSPSRPVASVEAYRASQKSWLEWLIQYYERDS
jgi:hypothetical protein